MVYQLKLCDDFGPCDVRPPIGYFTVPLFVLITCHSFPAIVYPSYIHLLWLWKKARHTGNVLGYYCMPNYNTKGGPLSLLFRVGGHLANHTCIRASVDTLARAWRTGFYSRRECMGEE